MRHWIHTPANTAALGASSALSIVAHALLVSAAVLSTEVRARELQVTMAQRVSFLPPPDRRPSTERTREKLLYIDVSGGAYTSAQLAATGLMAAAARPDPRLAPGGEAGLDASSEVPSAPVVSPDSVYSVLDVEESVVRAEDSAAPVYPPAMAREGKEGHVLMRYVVDTTGRVDMTMSAMLQSSHPLFAEAVREVLPRMRFTPAMVGGQKVRQLVEQNFTFRMALPTPSSEEQTRTALSKP